MLTRLAARVPLWVPYLVVAGGLVALSFYVPHDDVVGAVQDIPEPGQATLGILQQIMTLVLTLNAAMLAAAGALVVKGGEWSGGGWRRLEGLLVTAVFLCGVTSYFGVYSCQVAILTMVNAGGINPLETGLMWSLRLQYFGLISGALLLGLVFALMIDRRLRGAAERPPAERRPAGKRR